MDAEKLEKAKAGLKACSVGVECGEECPYENRFDEETGFSCNCELAHDALEVIEALEKEARAGVTEPTQEQREAVMWTA